MRTIKFRVWDNELKKYRSIQDGDYSLGVLSGKVRGIYGEKFPQMEVEQFTGLQDKNGVDAYSGDNIKGICILTDENGYDSNIEIEGVINYSDEYSAFAFTNNIKTPLENYCNFMHQLSEFEIIGNIHENPELLK